MTNFKEGDRVVCVLGWEGFLTEGKEYTILGGSGCVVAITADDGKSTFVFASRFKLADKQPTEDILEEALRLTTGDRNAQYGPPDQDFARTAALWSALFAHKLKDGETFANYEVAQAMICLKLSRLQHQKKRDSVVDGAGYFRCMDVCYRAGGGYDS